MTRNDVVEIVTMALRDQLEIDGVEYSESIDEQTPLLGRGSPLDSLGLVGVIVSVEQKMQEQTGQPMTLADEKAMSQRNSPFRTIGTLADYAMHVAGVGGPV